MSLSIERVGAIGIVTIDNPPVNALSQALRQALLDAADELDDDPSITAVVLTAAGRTFIAGADVGEFDRPPQPPHLPDVVARIERAKKPWIAAINGAALGGGLEIALGCRFRIAARGASLGMPEVRLGLVPGAGGTVRLPRLTSVEVAVSLVTGGSPLSASEAYQHGLVDAIVDGDLSQSAIAFAIEALRKPLPPPAIERKAASPVESSYWHDAERRIASKAKGEVAPLKALACVHTACEAGAGQALSFERATFLELRASPQARALRHVFFAERAALRPTELAGVEPRPIRSTAVVGGGTMGVGIAAALRDAGLPVTMIEQDQKSLEKALAAIRNLFEGAAKRGRITAAEARLRSDGVTGTTDYSALGECDLVIEAVFEDLEVKREVFARLARVCRTDAILATNTSYLDPDRIAQGLPNPERFIALHFFSPANVMRLVEIVPIPCTAPDVIATGFALARRLGKIPVESGICDGFIGNRILKTTRAQAERLLLAGCSPAGVDAAMRAFGLPMGPFEAQDLGGLDIAAYQRSAARSRGESPFAPVADRLTALGRYGQKTERGWYDYDEGNRSPRASSIVATIIDEEASKWGLRRRQWTDAQIADCIVLAMVNEGARILQEGVARRSADIDLVEIHGYGFPRWRGGLMHFAEARGLHEVIESLASLHLDGMSDPACPGLTRAAAAGGFSIQPAT